MMRANLRTVTCAVAWAAMWSLSANVAWGQKTIDGECVQSAQDESFDPVSADPQSIEHEVSCDPQNVGQDVSFHPVPGDPQKVGQEVSFHPVPADPQKAGQEVSFHPVSANPQKTAQDVPFHRQTADPQQDGTFLLVWHVLPDDPNFEFHRVEIHVGKPDQDKKLVSATFTCKATGEAVVVTDWKGHEKDVDDNPNHEIWSAEFTLTKCTGEVNVTLVPVDPQNEPVIKVAFVSKLWDQWSVSPTDPAFEFHRVDIAIGKPDKDFKLAEAHFVCVVTGEEAAGFYKGHEKDVDANPNHEIWSAVFTDKCVGDVDAYILPADKANDPVIKVASVSKGWDQWSVIPADPNFEFHRVDIAIGKPDKDFKLAEAHFICLVTGEEAAGFYKGHEKDVDANPNHEIWSAVFTQKCMGDVVAYIRPVDKANDPVIKVASVSKAWHQWSVIPADPLFEFHRVDIAIGKPDKNFKLAEAHFVCKVTGEEAAGSYKDHQKNVDENPNHEIWSAVFTQKCTGDVNVDIRPVDKANDPVVKVASVSKGWDRWTCTPDNVGGGYQEINVHVGKPDKDKKIDRVGFVCVASGAQRIEEDWKGHEKMVDSNPNHELWGTIFADKCVGDVDVYLLPVDKANNPIIKVVFFTNVDIPAVTEWGMAVMVLLVLAAGTVVIRRARALRLPA